MRTNTGFLLTLRKEFRGVVKTQNQKQPQQQSIYLGGPNKNLVIEKVPLNVNIAKQDLLHKKQYLKNLWSEVWEAKNQTQIFSLKVPQNVSIWKQLHKKQFGLRMGECYLSPSIHFHLDGSEHTVIKTSCHLIFWFGIKRKSSKIWTNLKQDVDKNWAKPTLNFDIFYIRLLRLCEVKKTQMIDQTWISTTQEPKEN